MMSNMMNIQEEVFEYIQTLTNEEQIITALGFATKNKDCGVDIVRQAVEILDGND
jgi:hypothetical protein